MQFQDNGMQFQDNETLDFQLDRFFSEFKTDETPEEEGFSPHQTFISKARQFPLHTVDANFEEEKLYRTFVL